MGSVVEEIGDRLRNGGPMSLIGFAEGQHLEAKSALYTLEAAFGRYELAKDVSAFANGTGGALLMGVSTTRDPQRETEILDSLVPFERSEFDAGRYVGILKEYVYPRIEGFSADFFETNGPRGVAVLKVPPQLEERKPFLISHVVDDGSHIREIVTGYAKRTGSHNTPWTRWQLYQHFRNGQSPHSVRLGRIEERLEEALAGC